MILCFKIKKQKDELNKVKDVFNTSLKYLPADSPDATELKKQIDFMNNGLKYIDAVGAWYAMIVLGAVLFSIFTLVTIFGIVALVIGKNQIQSKLLKMQ